MSKIWDVTIPIAGHAIVTVEADTEGAAIEKALCTVKLRDIEEFTGLQRVNSGNVCHFPSPWEAEATCLDEGEAA